MATKKARAKAGYDYLTAVDDGVEAVIEARRW